MSLILLPTGSICQNKKRRWLRCPGLVGRKNRSNMAERMGGRRDRTLLAQAPGWDVDVEVERMDGWVNGPKK